MVSRLDPVIKLIKQFEGCKLHAYLDSVGVPTIGYGSTHGTELGMVWTQAQAEAALLEEIERCAVRINNVIKKPITNNQLSALISFCYNIGLGAFYHSHLLSHLNAGDDKQIVAKEFLKWDHAGGRVLPGLTRRRKVEHDLYLS